MKIEVSIPDEVLGKAESLAIRLGLTKDELFCRALSDYIKNCEASIQDSRPDDDWVREALDAVYSSEDSSVDAVLAKMQWLSLPRENW